MPTFAKHITAATLAFILPVLCGLHLSASAKNTGGLMSSTMASYAAKADSSLSVSNVAVRLQKRVQNRFGIEASLGSLERALEYRRELLAHNVTVHFYSNEAAKNTWTVSLQAFPQWITFEPSQLHSEFVLDESIILQDLEKFALPLPRPHHEEIMTVTEKDGVMRAETSGEEPSDGYIVDTMGLAENLYRAFTKQEDELAVPAQFVQGSVVQAGDQGTKQYTLLATGKSDFSHSPLGRKKNIHKALEQQLHNVVIPKGAEFSFNDTLGGPITKSRGWHDSLIIVNGNQLEPAAGGGICQAATTMYRAMLLAGLPVGDRRSHSLYVTYYEKFGVGLDATIFPNAQDLTFVNDTPGDLLIRTKITGNEAEVSIWGTDDGREVTLEGPYFAATAPSDFTVKDRKIRGNEIAWKQVVTFPSGHAIENTILSTYQSVPRSLSAKYPQPEQVVLHTAAE